MKKFTLALLICFASQLSRAQTAQFPTKDSVINYLTGYWSWVNSCGGLNFGCSSPVTTGHSQGIRFARISGTTDSVAYKRFDNTALVYQGYAKISKDTTIYGQAWVVRPLTGFAQEVILSIAKPDSVNMSENCNDCFVHRFARGAIDVGISENTAGNSQVLMYPVPAGDYVTISIEGQKEFTLQSATVYTIDGKKVSEFLPEQQKLNVSQLAQGLYFMEVQTSAGQYRSRLIKN